MSDPALALNPISAPAALVTAGLAANQAAAAALFAAYQSRLAAHTLRRQRADLAAFAAYLGRADPEALGRDPAAWQGLTWGLVEGFVKWQLAQGYAIGSINVRLATVKSYCRLATQAGAIPAAAYTLIQAVRGYSQSEARRLDERRAVAGLATRCGRKKAAPVTLTPAQAARLKQQPDTPQGRRDTLLLCLLLDHGLRVGEAAGLQVEHFDLPQARFVFFRPKVNRVQTHRLTPDALAAAARYLRHDALAAGPLFRGSRKNGQLTTAGWATQKMAARVAALGEAAGVPGLSPHDCRHYWASQAAANGTPIDRLQDAGGWSNPVTPLSRYIRPAQIANEGVRLE